MQVFIIGTPIETAKALDYKRLNKQIIECQQIFDAMQGTTGWSNHPAVNQYRTHEWWLKCYMWCLDYYRMSMNPSYSKSFRELCIHLAENHNCVAEFNKPHWHTDDYYLQMKRRLYTKNPEHYNQWKYLGTSEVNWYWDPADHKFIKYLNGKRLRK